MAAQPYNIYMPTAGIYRATGDNGDAIYIATDQGIVAYSIRDPNSPTGNNYTANKTYLQSTYGIDFDRLPSFNKADTPGGQQNITWGQAQDMASAVSQAKGVTAQTKTIAENNTPQASIYGATSQYTPDQLKTLGGPVAQNPNLAYQQPNNTSQQSSSSAAQAQGLKGQPPTQNLQPGMSGAPVKQLQQWLIDNGFQIKDGATGYYGPETQGAVAALQSKLGVKTNASDIGYFGPMTHAAVQSSAQSVGGSTPQGDTGGGNTPQGGTGGSNTPQGGTSGGGNSQPSGIAYNPSWSARGITQDIWNSLNTQQQATIGATLDAASAIVANTGHSVTMEDALKAAATDPTIASKYADALNIDKLQFTQNLAQIQTAVSNTAQQQQAQFENERKALASQFAAAGAAYSGFRGLAEKQLGESESGVVTSTLSQLQKQLNDATTAFTAKYGTSATNPATATYVDPRIASIISLSGLDTKGAAVPSALKADVPTGITGSNVTGKQQDINALAGSYYQAGAVPTVKPA